MSTLAPRAQQAAPLLPFLLALVCAAPALAQEAPRPAPAAPAPDDRARGHEALLLAYQREYAFLVNEQAALEARVAELDQATRRRSEAGAAELQALEERLRALRLEAEAERSRLTKLDEEAATLDDGSDALEAVLSQAAAVLPQGAPAPASEDAGARITAVGEALSRTITLTRERARVRRAQGTFFLPGGAETTGDLVWVGAVACLGVSPQGAGALAPAGGGALQLWDGNAPEASAQAARAAVTGELPRSLPVFVFESLEKPADRPVVKTAAETVRRGGEVAYVIVGLGALAALLALARVVILALAAGDPDRTVDAVAPLLATGRVDEARARVGAQRGAAARVVAAMIPHLDEGAERLESAASERMVQEAMRIERFETAIMVSAAVAPLLGLLGTVTGMISTFDVITIYGTGDPKLLAGGISEALITTELGLIVAIPTLLAGNLLGSWTESIRGSMERAALRMTLLAQHQAEPVLVDMESARLPRQTTADGEGATA